jgi:tetratricopeptide (TPR) repeat protein
MLGNNDQALEDLDQSISLEPKSIYPYILRGTLSRERGAYNQAELDLTTALELDPNNAADRGP